MSIKAYTNALDDNEADFIMFPICIDTTESARSRGLLKPIIDGVNRTIEALKHAQNHAVMQVAVIGMAEGASPDFVPLDQMRPVSEADFPVSNGSPIADRLGQILSLVEESVREAYADQQSARAIRVYLALATDGVDAVRTDDNRVVRASRTFSDEDVAALLQRLGHGRNKLNAIAIGDGDDGLQAEAALICLGFQRSQIIATSATPREIRRAFDEVSRRSNTESAN